MIKLIFNAFCLTVVLISGISMFFLKYQVKDAERELKVIHRDILQTKREIHMLEAEWAHLNDPARLLTLVKSETNWQVIAPEQLVSLSDIPMRSVQSDGEVEIIETEQKVVEPVKPKPQKEVMSMPVLRQKPVLNKEQKHQPTVPDEKKTSLSDLAQNAKSLTQQPKPESKLKGTSQKDFVWSPEKRTRKPVSSTREGRMTR